MISLIEYHRAINPIVPNEKLIKHKYTAHLLDILFLLILKKGINNLLGLKDMMFN